MSCTGLSAEQQQQLGQYSELGKTFTETYYQRFDSDRSTLAGFYNASAILSFEGATYIGPQAIAEKLVSLPFQVVQHVVTVFDVHPLSDGSILVMVVGQLKTDNDRPHGFIQSFVLKKFGESFQICNDIFRLVLHHM